MFFKKSMFYTSKRNKINRIVHSVGRGTVWPKSIDETHTETTANLGRTDDDTRLRRGNESSPARDRHGHTQGVLGGMPNY